jgi:hypothetical protein
VNTIYGHKAEPSLIKKLKIIKRFYDAVIYQLHWCVMGALESDSSANDRDLSAATCGRQKRAISEITGILRRAGKSGSEGHSKKSRATTPLFYFMYQLCMTYTSLGCKHFQGSAKLVFPLKLVLIDLRIRTRRFRNFEISEWIGSQ